MEFSSIEFMSSKILLFPVRFMKAFGPQQPKIIYLFFIYN